MTKKELRNIIRELIQQHLEEISTTGSLVQTGGQQIAVPLGMGPKKKKKYKYAGYTELLESYNKFKKKITNPKQQMNNSVRAIEKHLREVEKIVDYNLRLKTEMDLGGESFYEGTNKRLARVSEKLNLLNNKLKELKN